MASAPYNKKRGNGLAEKHSAGFFAGILVIFISIIVIYLYFQQKNKLNEKANLKPSPASRISSVSISPEKNRSVCLGGIYQNKEIGYEVCYPKGWFLKEFGEGKETVGFDMREIPDATEYLGRMVIRFVEKPTDEQFSYYENNLNDFNWDPVMVGSISAKRIGGTIPQSALLFAGQKEVLFLIPFKEKTLEISLTDTADGYLSALPMFFDFVESFRFISPEPSFTRSSSGNIIVNSPTPNTLVSSPINVSGRARVFENVVNIRLEDSEGKVLLRTTAYAKAPDAGDLSAGSGQEFGEFSVPLYFSPPVPPSSGILKVFVISAKDGSEEDMVTILLRFR